jgi:hypothetical protein
MNLIYVFKLNFLLFDLTLFGIESEHVNAGAAIERQGNKSPVRLAINVEWIVCLNA